MRYEDISIKLAIVFVALVLVAVSGVAGLGYALVELFRFQPPDSALYVAGYYALVGVSIPIAVVVAVCMSMVAASAVVVFQEAFFPTREAIYYAKHHPRNIRQRQS